MRHIKLLCSAMAVALMMCSCTKGSNSESSYVLGHTFERQESDIQNTKDGLEYAKNKWGSTDMWRTDGTCRNWGSGATSGIAYYFESDNTVQLIKSKLYKSEQYARQSGRTDYLYSVYFDGNMCVSAYSTSDITYYTYAIESGKIVLTNGTIFTITSSGLIREGSSASDVFSRID